MARRNAVKPVVKALQKVFAFISNCRLSDTDVFRYSGADNMHFWGDSCKLRYKHQR